MLPGAAVLTLREISMDISILDANCLANRHLKLKPRGLHTVEDLLGEMDHFRISESLVVDSLDRENHPMDGNRKCCHGEPGLP